MISMKWRADSENSENSALDTFIVSHKIYEKKLFFHRFDFTSSDSPLKQPTGIVSSTTTVLIYIWVENISAPSLRKISQISKPKSSNN